MTLRPTKFHRWNFGFTDDQKILTVCKNEHGKSEGCNYVDLTYQDLADFVLQLHDENHEARMEVENLQKTIEKERREHEQFRQRFEPAGSDNTTKE